VEATGLCAAYRAIDRVTKDSCYPLHLGLSSRVSTPADLVRVREFGTGFDPAPWNLKLLAEIDPTTIISGEPCQISRHVD